MARTLVSLVRRYVEFINFQVSSWVIRCVAGDSRVFLAPSGVHNHPDRHRDCLPSRSPTTRWWPRLSWWMVRSNRCASCQNPSPKVRRGRENVAKGGKNTFDDHLIVGMDWPRTNSKHNAQAEASVDVFLDYNCDLCATWRLSKVLQKQFSIPANKLRTS